MDGELSLKTERRLIWDTELPFDEFSRNSSNFYYQNCLCWLVLSRLEMPFNSVVYKFSVASEETLSQPCEITSYTDNGSHRVMLRRSTLNVSGVTTLWEFYEMDNHLRSLGRIKIVIIFHCEVGSTLRLESENEKSYRDVETDVELDTPSRCSAHSTLEILSSDFSKLLDDDSYQDVELQCEDETFKAHKNVLSTRSKVFLAMLQSDMLEGQTARVEVKDMKSDVCKELLHYMYCGKIPELTSENARCLYEAADRYNVAGLMEPCAELLVKNLTPENSCEMLVLADAHSDPSFKEKVIQFMIDKKMPLEDDLWQAFCRSHSLLANEVLNRCYRYQNKK